MAKGGLFPVVVVSPKSSAIHWHNISRVVMTVCYYVFFCSQITLCYECIVCDDVNWWFYVAVCSVSSVNAELCFCLLLQGRDRPQTTIEFYQRRQIIEHGHVLPQPATSISECHTIAGMTKL